MQQLGYGKSTKDWSREISSNRSLDLGRFSLTVALWGKNLNCFASALWTILCVLISCVDLLDHLTFAERSSRECARVCGLTGLGKPRFTGNLLVFRPFLPKAWAEIEFCATTCVGLVALCTKHLAAKDDKTIHSIILHQHQHLFAVIFCSTKCAEICTVHSTK